VSGQNGVNKILVQGDIPFKSDSDYVAARECGVLHLSLIKALTNSIVAANRNSCVFLSVLFCYFSVLIRDLT